MFLTFLFGFTTKVNANGSHHWQLPGTASPYVPLGLGGERIVTSPVKPAGRVPRISRLLALAHHCFRVVQSGAIINQSELAHFGQISTTRMTQIMWLDNLAPDIQEEILFLPRTTQGRDTIKEADLRPIAKSLDWNKQRQMWWELKKAITLSS